MIYRFRWTYVTEMRFLTYLNLGCRIQNIFLVSACYGSTQDLIVNSPLSFYTFLFKEGTTFTCFKGHTLHNSVCLSISLNGHCFEWVQGLKGLIGMHTSPTNFLQVSLSLTPTPLRLYLKVRPKYHSFSNFLSQMPNVSSCVMMGSMDIY